ncbi:PBP1A family penicillin-binding protein [Patescibacteria group bacterium]|nr:PBP1A family penicillin-binding protein [Patescibacteria group bacterium]MBU1890955.1 PBP1A family penicillin-binding protein [Patescibacteria group bacterium]
MPEPTITPIYHKTWKNQHEPKPQLKRTSGKKRSLWPRLTIILVILVLIGIIFTIGVFAWYSRELPDPDKLLTRNLAQSTRIYDRTGETLLYEIHGDVKRTLVQLEEIPDNLKNATIAIEDKNFYEHSGFDITGFIRAVLINISSGGKSRPGGSTITQQLVKNAILTTEKTYTRKIKELVLSYQIERKFSKDQILKLYFNEIPYGSVAYGVESASQIYFGKSVQDLNLAEAAVLAALPQSPTYYSPYGSHVDELMGRQQYILNLMAEQGFISQEEADTAKESKVTFQPNREPIIAPHFVFFVKEILTEKYGENMVERGGLKVITSLDAHKQAVAEEAITDGLAKIEQYNGSNASLVALDPKTGELLAMVGSADYFDTENDGNVNVAIRNRQPGSSFKPVAYATAFDVGYTPETMLFDSKTNFGGDPAYIPNNYDGVEHGPVSMRQALAGSLNIPAVKTLYLAGVENTLETAQALGYTTLTDKDRYGLSLVLGGGEVKLLEHVGAFSVFAREGLRHPISAVLRVEDQDGKVLEEFKAEENRVMDEAVARNINSILSDNSARSFVFGGHNNLTLSDRPVAAKTGTTNDYRDAWTLGYTPSLVAGVWVGNNDNTSMKNGAAGAVVAAPIWNDFMETLLKGTPVESFKQPKVETPDKMMLNGQIDYIRKFNVDSLTNRIIPDDCLDNYPKEYISEKTYKETHTILHYVKKASPRSDPPDNPNDDYQYQRWEDAVQLWASGQLDYISSGKSLEYESCKLREDGDQASSSASASLVTPKDNSVIRVSPLDISLQVDSDFPLERVELYLGTELIKTLTKSPFSYEHDISDIENGFYTLKALFYDTSGSVYIDEHELNILLASSSATLYFTSPNENETVNLDDFPITVSGFAYYPGDIKILSLYYNVDDEDVLIKKITDLSSNQFSTTWTGPSDPGKYLLYFSVKPLEGELVQSNPLTLTITD